MNLLNMQLLEKNIDQIAEYDFSHSKVFGSAYWVWQQDRPVFQKCYGKDGLNGAMLREDSLFRLASMTKPITAVATLLLLEKGLIRLDDPISNYIPTFADIHIIDIRGNDLGAPSNPPTIRNILSHCSGIGSVPEKLQKMGAADRKDLPSSLRFFANAGLDFEPGSMQLYSGMGAFDVLTRIIEIVSGTDYLHFLQSELFTPCDMPDTTFLPTAEQQKRLVKMHIKTNEQNAEYEMPEGCIFESFPRTHFLGGAGLVSTLRDYANFASMLLYQGKTNTQQLLQPETLALLSVPQIDKGNGEHWGLGVRVITSPFHDTLPAGVFGWSGAYGSHFWVDPENKLFAVFMKNSKFDGGAYNESAVNFEKAVYSSFENGCL